MTFDLANVDDIDLNHDVSLMVNYTSDGENWGFLREKNSLENDYIF
jgi:hypothetical protein